ncbi:hypothetical protein GCM10010451_38110 [Streptomyces virens]|uniref:Uncharacterized protein n=1 Tax=Streptomyces virens TaxID=285572 RepID=A0ABP6PQG1_9ACTN
MLSSAPWTGSRRFSAVLARSTRVLPAPLPAIAETPTNRLNRLLSTFGDSLHDARTLAPSPGLSVRRRALRRRMTAQNTRPAL